MKLTAIAAIDESRVLADSSGIPWDVPEDYQHYLETVSGHPVIMGRKTAISATEDEVSVSSVTSNVNIVLTTRDDVKPQSDNIDIANSVDEALKIADKLEDEQVYVIGGGEIYEQFMPYIDEMVISHIEGEYDGTVHFPEWENDEWEVVKTKEREEFTIEYYKRINQNKQ